LPKFIAAQRPDFARRTWQLVMTKWAGPNGQHEEKMDVAMKDRRLIDPPLVLSTQGELLFEVLHQGPFPRTSSSPAA